MRKFGKLDDGSYICQLTAEEVDEEHRRYMRLRGSLKEKIENGESQDDELLTTE